MLVQSFDPSTISRSSSNWNSETGKTTVVTYLVDSEINGDPTQDGYKYYFADLRMTFRQNFFLQDWFRNKFGIGLGLGLG
jgi:hypothetical protein